MENHLEEGVRGRVEEEGEAEVWVGEEVGVCCGVISGKDVQWGWGERTGEEGVGERGGVDGETVLRGVQRAMGERTGSERTSSFQNERTGLPSWQRRSSLVV